MFGSVRVEITFCLMGKDERVLIFVFGRHDEIYDRKNGSFELFRWFQSETVA